MTQISKKNIVLVGNPNTGKSTLFNLFTGLNQKIGNFPGVTVDKKTGVFKIDNIGYNVIDLPGTYSLNPQSEDEKITRDYVLSTTDDDLIVIVADVTNLKRNLLLCTQIIDQGKQVILGLNMMDLLFKNKQEINLEKLSSLLGCPVIPINARLGKGIENLKKAISNFVPSNSNFLEGKHQNIIDDSLNRFKKIRNSVTLNGHKNNKLRS